MHNNIWAPWREICTENAPLLECELILEVLLEAERDLGMLVFCTSSFQYDLDLKLGWESMMKKCNLC